MKSSYDQERNNWWLINKISSPKKIYSIFAKSRDPRTHVTAIDRLAYLAKFGEPKAEETLKKIAETAPNASDRCEAAVKLESHPLFSKNVAEAFADPYVANGMISRKNEKGKTVMGKSEYSLRSYKGGWLEFIEEDDCIFIVNNPRVDKRVKEYFIDKIPPEKRAFIDPEGSPAKANSTQAADNEEKVRIANSKEEKKYRKTAEKSDKYPKLTEVVEKSRVSETRLLVIDRVGEWAENKDYNAEEWLKEIAKNAPRAVDRCEAALRIKDIKLRPSLISQSVIAALKEPDAPAEFLTGKTRKSGIYNKEYWIYFADAQAVADIAVDPDIDASLRAFLVLRRIPNDKRANILKNAPFPANEKYLIALEIKDQNTLEAIARDTTADEATRCKIIRENLPREIGAEILAQGDFSYKEKLQTAKKIDAQKALEDLLRDKNSDAGTRFDIVLNHIAPDKKAEFINDSEFTATQKCRIAVLVPDENERKKLLEENLSDALFEGFTKNDKMYWVRDVKDEALIFEALDRLGVDQKMRNSYAHSMLNSTEDETSVFAKYLIIRGDGVETLRYRYIMPYIDILTQAQLKTAAMRFVDYDYTGKTFMEFAGRITDTSLLGEILLANCRVKNKGIEENLDFFYDKLKDRQDILTELLLTPKKSFRFNDSTIFDYISDPDCLVKIACSDCYYNEDAAKKLPKEILATLADRKNLKFSVEQLAKVAAMELEIPTASEERILEIIDYAAEYLLKDLLIAASAKQKSNKAIADSLRVLGKKPLSYPESEEDLFSRLSDNKEIVSIIIKYPDHYCSESIIKIVRGKLSGSEEEKSFIDSLEREIISSDKKWEYVHYKSVAIIILSYYDDCSYSEAAWNHGGNDYVKYLISKIRYSEELSDAKRYTEVLSGIYRLGGSAANVARHVNGLNLNKHYDYVAYCASESESYYKDFTVQL